MTLRFRTVFWAAAALLVLVLLVFAFRPQARPVDLDTVARGDMAVMVSDEGYTRVRDVYAVSAPVGGRILRVDPEPGDRVAAGDVIARLLPSDPAFLDVRAQGEAEAAVSLAEAGLSASRAEHGQAEAALAFARSEYERVHSLFERDIASQAAMDTAQLQLRAAEAAENSARAAVRMRTAELAVARSRLLTPGSAEEAGEQAVLDIRAPADGVVLRILQESETPLPAGTVIMEIGDTAQLEVVAELLSTDAVQVEPGAVAAIIDWGDSAPALRGRVRRVEPYGFLKVSALGVEEQRVNVIVDIVEPHELWQQLGHGYRVETEITVWSETDVLQVPVAALFREEGEWAVFRAVEGRARLTPVEIGRDNGETAQVLNGLEAGMDIILYPGGQIEDGARIMPRS